MAKARLVAEVETKGAKKSQEELDDFVGSAEDAEKQSGKTGVSAKKLGSILLATGTAALTAATAITAIAVRSANAEREMAALARVAGEATNEFKALAFATESVNISAEKLSDISKDTNEKLGEFIATGGGGFKDFFEEVAPLVNLTANELQNLSGPQVLQRVKNALDEANISLEEQSFFLESIASDTTLLIPLLANEGAELQRLTNRFNDATAAIQLTSEESQGLNDLSQTFDLLTKQSSAATSAISSALAPTLDSFFNDVISVVPQATQAVVDFINAFVDAENIASIAVVEKRISETTATIDELQKKISERGPGTGGRSGVVVDRKQLESEIEELGKLNARLIELQNNQKRLEDASVFPGGGIQGVRGGRSQTVDIEGEQQLQALRDQATAFLAETDRLGRSRLELIELQERERLDVLREFGSQGLLEIQEFEDAKTRILEDSARQRREVSDVERTKLLESSEQFFGTLVDLSAQFGSEQSGVFKALFVAQKSFALASAINNIAIAQSQAASDPTAITPAQKLANVALIASQLAGILTAIDGNNFSARQQGGQFSAGQNLLVGEKGPELVQFGAGGRIANAGDTQGLLGSAPSVTIINQTTGRIDETEVQRDNSGDMVIIAREVLNREVSDPNSNFNKNFDRTRNAPRRLGG